MNVSQAIPFGSNIEIQQGKQRISQPFDPNPKRPQISNPTYYKWITAHDTERHSKIQNTSAPKLIQFPSKDLQRGLRLFFSNGDREVGEGSRRKKRRREEEVGVEVGQGGAPVPRWSYRSVPEKGSLRSENRHRGSRLPCRRTRISRCWGTLSDPKRLFWVCSFSMRLAFFYFLCLVAEKLRKGEAKEMTILDPFLLELTFGCWYKIGFLNIRSKSVILKRRQKNLISQIQFHFFLRFLSV